MPIPQLTLYNNALGILGERSLASLTENREPRRVLDELWDSGNAVTHILEEGQWKFSLRTSKMIADPTITPSFGYRVAFQVPTDCVRFVQVCSDEYLNSPLTAYSVEAGVFYSDLSAVYVQYVSKDVTYGFNSSLWPETFKDYLSAWLASRAALRITQSDDRKKFAIALLKQIKSDALAKDAMQGPTQFTPQGSWTRARGGRSNRDRGNRSSFYG